MGLPRSIIKSALSPRTLTPASNCRTYSLRRALIIISHTHTYSSARARSYRARKRLLPHAAHNNTIVSLAAYIGARMNARTGEVCVYIYCASRPLIYSLADRHWVWMGITCARACRGWLYLETESGSVRLWDDWRCDGNRRKPRRRMIWAFETLKRWRWRLLRYAVNWALFSTIYI